MDPVDQPDASKPKSDGGSAETMGAADVEKTFEKLEGMASTLAQEIGTSVAKPETPPVPADTAPVVPAQSATPIVTEWQAQPTAAQSTDPAGPAAGTPEAASPAAEPVPDAGAAAGVQADATPAVEQEQPAAGTEEAPPQDESPAGDKVEGESDPSSDAEVEQEINQAIQQLQGGKPAAAGKSETAASPASVSTNSRSGLLRRLARTLDAILFPLAMVVVVVDMPFRWLPGAVRQLLGYVAVGTTLMAGALWYYIITSHPK